MYIKVETLILQGMKMVEDDQMKFSAHPLRWGRNFNYIFGQLELRIVMPMVNLLIAFNSLASAVL